MKHAIMKSASIVVVCFISFLAQTASFTYSYDSLNRLTNATYSDGGKESYSYDLAGNRISELTEAATVKVDITTPSTPTNLVQAAFVPSELTVSWNRAFDTGGSGLAGYEVFANGILVATTTKTNFSLTGLSLNTQYCVAVAAMDHAGNLSQESSLLCLTTPVFEAPYLNPYGISKGQLQIGVTGGTPGPYDVWGSSNLLNWQKIGAVKLPLTNSYFTAPDSIFVSPHFYRFGWSTNSTQ
jgi:YD repeat-containing protein